MLDKKLQDLSRIVNDLIDVPLFTEIPSAELQSINKPVTDNDSLRARITDLCNVLDRTNKKAIDKFTQISSKGSRDSLVSLFKKMLPRDHSRVGSDFEERLSMILLMRAHLTHGKNKNIKYALSYFDITPPITDHSNVWEKVRICFNDAIDNILEMLNSQLSQVDIKQEDLDSQLGLSLKRRFLDRYGFLLKKKNVKKLLVYLLSEESAIDSDMAKIFNMELSDLRETLLPFVPNLLRVSYHDSMTTRIRVSDHALVILNEVYFESKNDDN